ncbi:MAG TPA: OpgC domain-containing protein [Chloroflexota bacterium]|nr:OpgC domain-containing protein [Chloroflexota bacterium]
MYMRGNRDLRIDFLRGAAGIAMLVDHVGGDKSWLYAITGGDRWYVSAAECFVLLSGVVTGIVYGPIMTRHGGGPTTRKLLKRAGLLYLWSTVMTLLEPFVANLMGLGWEDPLRHMTLLEWVVSVVTMHRTYHLTDVLLLYALLFSTGSIALAAFDAGKTKGMLILSWAIWALWQTSIDYPAPWDIQGLTVFQFAAWQALFVTGLALGFHRKTIAPYITPERTKVALIVGWAAIVAAAVSYDLRGVNRGLGPVWATHLLSKTDLGPGRLFVFAFLCMLGVGMVIHAWQYLYDFLGWLVLPIGQHSLSAYLIHVPVVMVVTRLGMELFGGGYYSPAQNVLLEIVGTLGVWALIQLGLHRNQLRRVLPAIGKAAVGAWLDTCYPDRRCADMNLPEPSSRSV